MNATYARFELLRLLRNKRSFIFSLIFPLALFLVIGGSQKNTTIESGPVTLKFTTFYMVSMASYGAMIAATSGGARIAAERSVGWTRQLRITPLPVRTYFGTKVVTAYVMALASIGLLFATHYLEEEDANADRIVLMARGEVVADGPATEIKATAGGRIIRATLPDVSADRLETLDGVRHAELHGEAIILNCSDSDAAVRALLREFPAARDLEITGAGLEAAFLQLTGERT